MPTPSTSTCRWILLNPSAFYDNPIFAPNTKVEGGEAIRDGLLSCIQRLSPNTDIEDQVLKELPIYESASGLFGKPSAIRQRTQMALETCKCWLQDF
nr:hypothetical protein [Tanacetum cinerariifolium]